MVDVAVVIMEGCCRDFMVVVLVVLVVVGVVVECVSSATELLSSLSFVTKSRSEAVDGFFLTRQQNTIKNQW